MLSSPDSVPPTLLRTPLISCVGSFPDIHFFTPIPTSTPPSSPFGSLLQFPTPTPLGQLDDFSLPSSASTTTAASVVSSSREAIRSCCLDKNPNRRTRTIAVSHKNAPYGISLYDLPPATTFESPTARVASCQGVLLSESEGSEWHRGPVWALGCLEIGDEKSLLVSGCNKGTILVSDWMEGRVVCGLSSSSSSSSGTEPGSESDLESPVQYACRLCTSETDPVVVLGGYSRRQGGKVCVLEILGSGSVVVKKVLEGHTNQVHGIDIANRSGLVYSVAYDRKAKVWSMQQSESESESCVATVDLASRGFSCCCLEEKNILLVGLQKGGVEVWDTRKLDERMDCVMKSAALLYDLVPISDHVCVSGSNGMVSLIDVDHLANQVSTKVSGRVFGVSVIPEACSEVLRSSLCEIAVDSDAPSTAARATPRRKPKVAREVPKVDQRQVRQMQVLLDFERKQTESRFGSPSRLVTPPSRVGLGVQQRRDARSCEVNVAGSLSNCVVGGWIAHDDRSVSAGSTSPAHQDD